MCPPLPSDASPVAPDLAAAADLFFPDLAALAGVTGHPHLVRVETGAGPRLVRRWPEGIPVGDVTFTQEVMAAAGEAGVPAPVVVPPSGESHEPVLRHERRLYTAQTWLPGETPGRAEVAWPEPDVRIDLPLTLPPALFAAIASSLARLHDSAVRPAGRAPEAPLGLLPGAVRQAHERHLSRLRARAPREPAIQRWLATSERLLDRAEPVVLQATQERAPDTTLLHLGLWPSHVLVADGSLAGLLGWERVAVGSPLLDLAQAVLRLQGWQDEAVELALGSYAETRALSPDERRLLPAVAALDAVASTGRLLEQTYVVAATARPPSALRAGIDMMLRSLTALERDLTAQESVGKSRRTLWRHAPRGAPRREREGDRPRVRRR